MEFLNPQKALGLLLYVAAVADVYYIGEIHVLGGNVILHFLLLTVFKHTPWPDPQTTYLQSSLCLIQITAWRAKVGTKIYI